MAGTGTSALVRILRWTLLLVVGFYVGARWDAVDTGLEAQPARARPVASRGDLTTAERSTIELFRDASPSVVFITSLAVRRDFFSFNLLEIPRGTGSGFVWSEDGHVVTNYHVIEGAQRARVTLADQSTWDARAIGAARDKDLAVLKIDAPRDRLKPIPLGTSSDLQVGQSVLAIGNPFGFDQSLTTGVISALGREIESVARIPIRDVIQTDAAINPGNSGGPLLDSSGRLIGVNTAIYSPSGAYAGIGFAIPADTVSWVVPDLIAYGAVRRAALGIRAANDSVTRRLGVEGVLIVGVDPGSGAERAGLRPTRYDRRGAIELGDIIVGLDGQPVESFADLRLGLEQKRTGEEVEVTVLRGRRRVTVPVVLSSQE
jgi:S1-C subfamily serine protease